MVSMFWWKSMLISASKWSPASWNPCFKSAYQLENMGYLENWEISLAQKQAPLSFFLELAFM